MKSAFLVGAIAVACLSSVPAAARLVSQKVTNGVRACLFEDLLGHREELRLPVEDTCPAFVHERRQALPLSAEVPPLAILTNEEQELDGRYCVYALNGIQYRRLISVTGTCTYTPY